MFLGLDSVGSVVLFTSYVLLWTSQGILVHLANHNGLTYNTTSAVFMQDLCKLLITIGLFKSSEGTLIALWVEVKKNRALLVLYMIPAGMYALYNNLTFYALTRFDPSSYFVLLQFKIVITAGLSVLVLKKTVTPMQWAGLVVIMLGSMLKESDVLFAKTKDETMRRTLFDYLIIFIQLSISAFAGIYTEKLLKSRESASPNVQNVFMYVDGMICNTVALMYKGQLLSAFSIDSLATLTHPNIVAIIFNFSVVGVVTGFFLKKLGNILKSIAGALELWGVAIFSSIIFGYPVTVMSGVAITIVSAGIWLYSSGAPKPATAYQRLDQRSTEDEEAKKEFPMKQV